MTEQYYHYYCVNCGFTYGYLQFLKLKKNKNKKEKIECPQCHSKRFKKCYSNLYGKPILPSRFMEDKPRKEQPVDDGKRHDTRFKIHENTDQRHSLIDDDLKSLQDQRQEDFKRTRFKEKL